MMSGTSSPIVARLDSPSELSTNLSGQQNPRAQEYLSAKSFLLGQNDSSGNNLFEHLTSCLKKILEERPDNVVDVFEDISREVKKTKASLTSSGTSLNDQTLETALAEIQKKLFDRGTGEDEEPAAVEADVEMPLPNLMETAFFFEQAGIGLNREELVRIWLSMKTLVDNNPIQTARFWGKIFGTEQNYYVAEVEFREGDDVEEEEEEEEEADAEEDAPGDRLDEKAEEGEEGEEAEDKPPKSQWKPAPVVPKEDSRSGANKRVYFVCNEPGKQWTRLPPVTPAQIVIARQIKKFFSGRLDAPVVTFPPFPGTEQNYLRAQISRISAGTQVSPLGYYQFDQDGEEEEAEEGAGVRDNYVVNAEYEPLSVSELADPATLPWMHHTAHILPQGRCSWWNPTQKSEDEFNEEEEEGGEDDEGRAGGKQAEPEHGPPVLTGISEDVAIDGQEPWSARLSSSLLPEFAVATVASNLWPGAFAFAYGKTFENVYLGWGHKYSVPEFTPAHTAPVLTEFPVTSDTTEALDPTPQEEAALRASQNAGGEEGGAEGGAEEGEVEDDDE